MNTKMTEAEFIANFDDALKYNHIHVYYQPQINHSTGRMIGAEALMRWSHPAYRMQSPADFIPVLEKNNLIYAADMHVFELVCSFLRRSIDKGLDVVPISVNMSRYDIFNHDYANGIESIRKKYDIPVKYLRIEITESSAIGGMELIKDVLAKFHSLGYLVEMDDFGSGYSSLNVLKDLEVDIIKLDMRFLSGEIGGRGGAILGSIVQMAKWLHTPVIAEGVETLEQADYMKSIGCNYIQGYLYSRPLPEKEFTEKMQSLSHEPLAPEMKLIDEIDSGKFWNPDSMETLIFSNFVGAAAVFTYDRSDGHVEIVRVNEKYIKEIGMEQSENQLIESDPWQSVEEASRTLYREEMEKAIEKGEERTCESWRSICSKTCGTEKICVRSNIRVIGQGGNQYLFYAMVQNITAEKKRFDEVSESERRFRAASEQVNIYAWEYDIATKEMRPCFRCMRDLGLPPLLKNYPEPAIEVGIFPPDYADMYRDWHRQLAEGVEHLEAIIPLTVGRVPFHVRYTTEFDENGRPLKAYGSAALVVDNDTN